MKNINIYAYSRDKTITLSDIIFGCNECYARYCSCPGLKDSTKCFFVKYTIRNTKGAVVTDVMRDEVALEIPLTQHQNLAHVQSVIRDAKNKFSNRTR